MSTLRTVSHKHVNESVTSYSCQNMIGIKKRRYPLMHPINYRWDYMWMGTIETDTNNDHILIVFIQPALCVTYQKHPWNNRPFLKYFFLCNSILFVFLHYSIYIYI